MIRSTNTAITAASSGDTVPGVGTASADGAR